MLTIWTANHFEAMNRGDSTAGRLQRAMWRLLLAHIPRRCSTNHELAARFKLWRQGEYETLLERIESQVQIIPPSGGPNVMLRARRARRMSQNGAHRKAVMAHPLGEPRPGTPMPLETPLTTPSATMHPSPRRTLRCEEFVSRG